MYALKVKKLAIIAHLPTSGVTLLVIRKLDVLNRWLVTVGTARLCSEKSCSL